MGSRGAGAGGGREHAAGGPAERRARALDEEVRAAVAAGDLGQAERRLAALEGGAFARTPLGAALAASAAALVALATDRPANADALATAAAEHARAIRSPALEARAAVLAGRAQAALGADDVAAERFAEARSLARLAGDGQLAREADRCRAALASRASAAAAGPAERGLTARQLEIALLAADGRTNREVAAALGISEHTVNAHLRAAFRRLGVSRRRALATVLNARAQR
ncbi:helix-turn-helix transcriptional regulator [Conexibacter arvalis]|uniref:DNA-binding CsgD family transcriptional regulator n=1 Tax=Conexibacter arvalis TaxID=912552 RepID=A0A840I951_9ACTN|nr:LuxR C-terminal-related transcriptional regulator [Conexibacter arvalis]MBB4660845.1 DNA-binding CsgD family transcriptional regulator [Conexibacter arvalis]